MRCLLYLLSASLLAAQSSPADALWQASAAVYQKTLTHPFLLGLTDGSLPQARFEYYLRQDSAYLDAFAQSLIRLSAKAPRKEWAETLRNHARESIAAEKQRAPAEMAPVNYAYTNHIRVAIADGTFAEGLAALLPCYWIYQEVGRVLVKKGSRNPAYQKWIDNYAGEEYAKSVRQVLAMYNAEAPKLTAAQRAKCKELFIRSAQYEYMFWDMAWREEQWLP
ncbi:MAG TPA: TenA family protein [Bryobacteraceae bacterium]|nr:TenA family protein [Bryobacteraceae bacterium]